LYHFGCLLEKIGENRIEDSFACFNEAIKLDNKYAPAYNARGLLYDKIEQYENAHQDFSISIKHDNKNPVYIHNRACCLRNMNRLEESI